MTKIDCLFYSNGEGFQKNRKLQPATAGKNNVDNNAAHKSAAVGAHKSSSEANDDGLSRPAVLLGEDDYNDAVEQDEQFVLKGDAPPASKSSSLPPPASSAFFNADAFITHFDDEPSSSEEDQRGADAIDYDAKPLAQTDAGIASLSANDAVTHVISPVDVIEKDADGAGDDDVGETTTIAGMENILLQLNVSSLSLFT
jgi:hypothetical protein